MLQTNLMNWCGNLQPHLQTEILVLPGIDNFCPHTGPSHQITVNFKRSLGLRNYLH